MRRFTRPPVPTFAFVLALILVAAPTWASDPSPRLAASFFAYDPSFAGGVTVAVCGPDAIGRVWVATATATDGGLVRLFMAIPEAGLLPLGLIAEWLPYGGWSGGVNLSCSLQPLTTHTIVYVTTGAGPGGGPHVIVWRLLF